MLLLLFAVVCSPPCLAVPHCAFPIPLQCLQQIRKAPERRAAATLGPIVKVQGDGGDGGDDQQETDRQMETMWATLCKVGTPVTMMHTVLDPLSFGQTVENMFTLSFLVRDQRVRLYINDDGEYKGAMMVEVIRRSNDQQQQPPGVQVQFVAALDMDDWVRIIRDAHFCRAQHSASFSSELPSHTLKSTGANAVFCFA